MKRSITTRSWKTRHRHQDPCPRESLLPVSSKDDYNRNRDGRGARVCVVDVVLVNDHHVDDRFGDHHRDVKNI